MYATRECAKRIKINLKGATAAVQGYGNAGYHSARLLAGEQGTKVVAASDSSGGVYNASGLDPVALNAHKAKKGTVVGFPGSKGISNEELLELDVDVLVPAALENQITTKNAKNVKAKIVAEGANGPTTPEADDVLFKKGIYVIPDILANGGGVTVSYFEWVQNLAGYAWSGDEVRDRLEKNMVQSVNNVWEMAQREKVDLRMGAYMVAIQRVAEAYRVRGIYP